MFRSDGKMPGLMISAPRSGSGKTTVTLGLLRALTRRGLTVQAFKCGPDYIDPAFHQAASRRPSYNLDSWAMRRETAGALLAKVDGADFALIEAAMGLFDGVAAPGAWGTGASADVAALTGLPIILVIDVSGQSQTAAAAARGFAGFRSGVDIAGVILNRVASERHERLVRQGFEETGMRVFGCIPRQEKAKLPERHLGLVQAAETPGLPESLESLADMIETHVDVEGLLHAGAAVRIEAAAPNLKPPGQRIALARDIAFSFIYPHLIDAWRAAGAEILPFSPLADEAPDPSSDAVWLPGGYPELHAGRLASNSNFLCQTRKLALDTPIHGECGGYMVLGGVLTSAEGERHAMLGLLQLETSFARRKLHLGYRRARIRSDCVLGPRGTAILGHEFHYTTILEERGERLFDLSGADGAPVASGGLRDGHVTGSFLHIIDAHGFSEAMETAGTEFDRDEK